MSSQMSLIIISLTLIIPCMGFLLAATPWLMPKRECFTVTVPETAHAHPQVKRIKQKYSLIIAVLTAIATTATGASLSAKPEAAGVVVMMVSTFLLIGASFALMLHYRQRIAAIKAREGWQSTSQTAVSMASELDMPKLPRLTWNLAYVPIVLATVVIGVIGYPLMPDQLPMHADFSGTVNDWAPKSPITVMFPVYVQLFLIACFMLSHWTILRSKKGGNPEHPAASTYAYLLFARAQIIFLLVLGVITCCSMNLFHFTSMGMIDLGTAGALIVVLVALPALAGSIGLSVVYGQSGSKVVDRIDPSCSMKFDDDEHWKLGVFYVNREDSSLFVPERFGIGWTVNLAQPKVWAIIGGLVAVTIIFIAGAFLLVE